EHSTRLESRPRPETARPMPYPRPSSLGSVGTPPPVLREVKPGVVSPASSAPSGTPAPAGSDWVFCGHCGEKIGGDDVYCAHCGQRQPSAEGGAATGAGPETRITAQLVVLSTTDMVKPITYSIDKQSILIGRTDPHTGIFPEIDLTMY